MKEAVKTFSGKRLIALDAFRGFTIAAMIVVNNPGSWDHVYTPLLHAEWHGVTPTDLIFPFFLFIIGVSISLAFDKRLALSETHRSLIRKAAIRSLKIFGLGLFLNLWPEFDLAEMRIPGVLQRIAVVYIVCAVLYLKVTARTLAALGILILGGYWLALSLIPSPATGDPNLLPGLNLVAWIDRQLIPGRMWQGSWDPEGLVSTWPAVATGLTGMLTGKLLGSDIRLEQKTVWLFFAGFLLFAAGIVWGWVFPINKNLWTSSYTLFSAGLAMGCLAAFIWTVDYLDIKSWVKFGVVYGSNAIAIYTLAGMLPALTSWSLGADSLITLFFNGLCNLGLPPQFVSLCWALLFCLICYLPAWILYRKRIFIKV